MTSAFLSRLLDGLRAGGDRPAFRHGGTVTSYRAAYRALFRLHGALAAEGVGPGDVVAVRGGNRPETVLAQLAAQLRGASVLLVGASATAPDRRAALTAAGVTVLLADPGLGDPARDGVPRVLPLTGSGPGTPAPPRPPASVHAVFLSGGTTGAPKLIGHRGIYDGMAHIFRPDPDGPNRTLVVSPVTHLTGNCAVLGALLCGDTVVLHDGFDPEAVLAAIGGQRVTHLSLTPPRLARLLDHPALADTDTASVRRLSLGASPLPSRRLRQALAAFGPVVGQGYGLTEAPMIASISAEDYAGHPGRHDSVGRIVPGMEARIDGADGAGDGAVGEVLVRGLALMEGYVGRPDLTRRAFTGGWLRTGDVGRFDADGYLYLLDRLHDVIVTGEHGTKVYSTVVEDALTGHPGVRQAAVFGVPGPDGEGERVHAVVVADPGGPGEDVLRAHVRALLDQDHPVPARIEFAGALPLTDIGKVDKQALRAPHWAGHSRGIA
ncbi:acyl-CoA synthetase (AMP-forming)/AMP-acid ligase II [Prauserella shujinwangii]|uniref:Acyl-CoA synthetase (AMP-forming)/AMP-acid ligase II n=1 Tax=Prauserella shujinwangii TaxID=1453103 RepID=A0A2T0LMS0_9PSEU|nr:AMP-binding protein [Prauserella shujinwangii]PRX44340.1 acyl-CoA synthetase (AMP-forming)/AMP-acid ligase II [Prauserella shujinwangii]